ncbi:MAG TPA: DUF4349 domain-containing protein [Anaerolineae bacterium]|nr:DUF4349 domain-containing protein [Anaerolineae bacterium]
MKLRWWKMVVVWLGLMVLAGCASKARAPLPMEQPLPMAKGEETMGVSVPESLSVADEIAAQPSVVSGEDAAQGQQTERLVVRTAYLSIVVPDPEATMNDLAGLAEEMGGFVVSSGLSTLRLANGDEVPQASITFRVPAEKFQESLSQVRSMASRVNEERIQGQDVTEEYVDLQARLRNLRAAEKQLQEIMDQATRTEDVLHVYRELTNIRGEIERLQGRIRYLEQAAAMSSITVGLVPDEAAQPLRIGGWEPKGVVRDALQALIRTLQGLVTVVIWLIVYLLPVLVALGVVFGLPVFGLIRLWRRRKRRVAVSED